MARRLIAKMEPLFAIGTTVELSVCIEMLLENKSLNMRPNFFHCKKAGTVTARGGH